MHFCKPEILLTWRNTTSLTLFDMFFSFIVVVIKSWIFFSLWFSVMKQWKTANWKQIDSCVRQQLHAWNKPAPVFEISLLPHELFERFLTNTEMERICIESTHYVSLKGNHMFTMIVEKRKPFLTILLVSGYAGLRKQEIY